MLDTPSVLFAKETLCTISSGLLQQLKKMALDAPTKRARFCLHRAHEDAVQEMVIVLHYQSHIRPHRHLNKTESFHMIEGEVLIAFFNDQGSVDRTVYLSSHGDQPFMYRLSTGLWHSVLSMTEYAIFHEVSTGPFTPPEYALWEPEQTPKSIQRFKNHLLSVVTR